MTTLKFFFPLYLYIGACIIIYIIDSVFWDEFQQLEMDENYEWCFWFSECVSVVLDDESCAGQKYLLRGGASGNQFQMADQLVPASVAVQRQGNALFGMLPAAGESIDFLELIVVGGYFVVLDFVCDVKWTRFAAIKYLCVTIKLMGLNKNKEYLKLDKNVYYIYLDNNHNWFSLCTNHQHRNNAALNESTQ